MKTLRKLLLISIALTLSACAAKYAPNNDGFWSNKPGYIAIPIDSSTYRVAFNGKNNTLEVTDRYAFYRAAELTVDHDYDYFIVLDKENSSDQVLHTGVPMTTTSGPYTNVATGTTTTTSTTTQSIYSGTKHSSTKTIRMFKGDRPGDNANAFDAKSMLAVMGPTINK